MIPRYSRPEMAALWTDQHRLEVMLEIEALVLEAQAKLGLAPADAASVVRKRTKIDVKRVAEIENRTRHDVIAFIEHVEEQIGAPYGKYLHFGLTSSDVLDTALAVILSEASRLLVADLQAFLRALRVQARRHKYTLTIGRSHGIHAEPTTFGLKLAVYYDEFNRHLERLKRASDEVRVGKLSGAVGTFANVDPRVERSVCRRLGLKPAPISTQIVERDLHAQYVSTLALIGASIENLAVEIRHLQRTEVREAEEAFGKGQKGSSAMPHKKNPVVCEQMTGLARLLRSYTIAALENITLWHERDISHSSVERVVLPDATSLLDYMLHKMTGLVEGLVVHQDQMLKNLQLTQGVVFSGQVLLALMRHGLSRTQAYERVQAVALNTWRTGQRFEDALEKDGFICGVLSAAERKRCVDPAAHMKHVDMLFKRVGLE